MGGRSPILVGLVLVMVLGCAIYFRLWTIDYTISSDETEILRFVSIFSLFFNSRAILFLSKRKSPFWSVWLMRKSFRRIKENKEVHSSYAIWFSWAESIFRNPGQIKCRFDSLFFFFDEMGLYWLSTGHDFQYNILFILQQVRFMRKEMIVFFQFLIQVFRNGRFIDSGF